MGLVAVRFDTGGEVADRWGDALLDAGAIAVDVAEAPSVRIESADNAAFDSAVTKITDVVRNSGVEPREHADVLHGAAPKRA